MRRGCSRTSPAEKNRILPQFLTIDHHFVRKGCSRTSTLAFFLSFWRSTFISCERVTPGQVKSQFYLNFCRSTFISCERVSPGQVRHKKNGDFPQFLTIDHHFVRKGCSRTSKLAILHQFLTIDPHIVRKGYSGTSPAQVKSQFYLGFCTSSLVSCERVARAQVKSQVSHSFAHRPSFPAKRLLRDKSGTSKIAILPRFLRIDLISCERVAPGQVKSQFYLSVCASTLISCERFSWTSPAQVKSQSYLGFCASTLISCERVDVSWLLAGTTLGLKREDKEGEREKRERERRERERREERGERKRKCEDVSARERKSRCQYVKMWVKEDERVWVWICEWRCEDVRVRERKKEDVSLWRCENVWVWVWRCEYVKM